MGLVDLILVVLFCYQLHRMAIRKGVSPWPYVVNYVGIFVLLEILFFAILFSLLGREAMESQEAIMKNAMYFVPIPFSYEILLFIYLRKKLNKATVYTSEEDDESEPPAGPKKDLSYFR